MRKTRIIRCETCSVDVETRGNYRRFCAACRQANDRAKRAARGAQYRARHPERQRASYLRWQTAHREHCRAYSKHWAAAHREQRHDYSKRFREEHRDEILAQRAAQREQHPYRRRCANANRTAAKFGVPGVLTEAIVATLLATAQGRCRYCGRASDTLEVEHMVPMSRGGNNTVENLSVACRHCNSSKGSKTADEYLALLHADAASRQGRDDV